ncbi:MAG: hypothetical protein IPI46_04030 [Bacteroidetes bacterium]|nr:hypothetical protein [Bacteroidota bacterium]
MEVKQKRYVFILLDIFLKKNHIQHHILINNGYYPIWLQCSTEAKSQQEHGLVLPNSFFARTFFLHKLLFKYRNQIHHVEIYPGGRYAPVFLLLAKLFNLKVLCVERGDLYYLVHKKYKWLTRISGLLIYRFSALIWTRELYAKEYLEKLNIKTEQRFIHNVIQLPEFCEIPYAEKDIDFLWVNSLKDFRKLEWFLAALRKPLQNQKLDGKYYKSQIDLLANKPSNLQTLPYTSPHEYYRRARFFVLPTSLVYLNSGGGGWSIFTGAGGPRVLLNERMDLFQHLMKRPMQIV